MRIGNWSEQKEATNGYSQVYYIKPQFLFV